MTMLRIFIIRYYRRIGCCWCILRLNFVLALFYILCIAACYRGLLVVGFVLWMMTEVGEDKSDLVHHRSLSKLRGVNISSGGGVFCWFCEISCC